MNIKLINKYEQYTPVLSQVLKNREIEDINNYLNLD